MPPSVRPSVQKANHRYPSVLAGAGCPVKHGSMRRPTGSASLKKVLQYVAASIPARGAKRGCQIPLPPHPLFRTFSFFLLPCCLPPCLPRLPAAIIAAMWCLPAGAGLTSLMDPGGNPPSSHPANNTVPRTDESLAHEPEDQLVSNGLASCNKVL